MQIVSINYNFLFNLFQETRNEVIALAGILA
jgi:hypothetical protein